MEGKSLDVKKERIEKLKALMPEVFNEDDNIDFDKLKLTLGESVNTQNERYVLNWAGKSDSFKILQTPTTATLAPDKEESVNFDTTENIFIEGENLEVLKVLQKSYFGKIKMIYIDPPYNTGNDSFIYPDKFSESKDQYLKRIGEKDEEGFLLKEGLFRKNSKENGQYHSNWLSMMYPRLYLARNLLREDGVIFVSIDDNEVHNLRMVMNEIFGEENFVGCLKWKKKKQPSFLHGHIASVMEYILIYGKHSNELEKLSIETRTDANTRIDNASNNISERVIKKGIRVKIPKDVSVITAGVYKNKTMQTEYLTDVFIKDGRTLNETKIRAQFRNEQTIIDNFVKEDLLFITKNYGLRRDLLKEELERRKSITDLLLDWGDNQDSDTEMNELFPEGKPFEYPKPSKLLLNLIESVNSENEIILDFFAGSGATAHAVLKLNREYIENRKFILVQLPERVEKDSVAYKSGFMTISDICKERIRRVIKKLESGIKNEQLNLDKEDNLKIDLGFKVFKLKHSNFKLWRSDVIENGDDLGKQLDAFEDPVKKEAEEINIVYELLLKLGYNLNVDVEKQSIFIDGEGEFKDGAYIDDVSGNFQWWNIDSGKLLIVTEAVMPVNNLMNYLIGDGIKPEKVICLDRIFDGSDEEKTNLVLQMKDAGIEFKTV